VEGIVRHPFIRAVAALAPAAAIAALVLWMLPKPHGRLQGLIAGTAGTLVWLGLALAIVIGHKPALRAWSRDR